jgi:ribosomal protein S18 acetylase RimI-like enzyme
MMDLHRKRTPTWIIRPFHPDDTPAVTDLWQICQLVVPANDPRRDMIAKTAFQPDLFLVGIWEGALVASVMAGYEGHRGWINYLAVAPAHRRHGLGRAMLAAAEERLGRLGCPKINLQVRRHNRAVLEFYRRLGYVEDEVISLGKRLR